MVENNINIQLAPGAEEIGLAAMIKDLIAQNLEQNPHKIADFVKLNIGVGLIVTDVAIEMTMAFSKGDMTVYSGVPDESGIVIRTRADIVMAMSNTKIKWGLPYYFNETGREILQAMRNGGLKIRGMILHLPSLIRLSRVMSVNP
jgi:hypothetical protein